MVATSKIAFLIFGRWVQKHTYGALQKDLRKAGMAISADLYVSTAMLSSLMAFIGIAAAGIVFALIRGALGLLTLALPILAGLGLGFGVYRFLLFYPGVVAKNRAYKINLALPNTIGFIHAMSRSGANVVDIFRELSMRSDVGELRNEARVFMRDVEYLGHDPLTALRDLAQTTPSQRLKEFLEVLAPIAETGGDMTKYFASKWAEYQENARADQGKFVSTLELYSELYITLIMLMPLLMLLVIALLGPMGGFSNAWLYLIGYLMIPIGAVAFMILVSMTMPEKFTVRAIQLKTLEVYKGVPMVEGDVHEEKMIKRLSGGTIQQRLRSLLKKPAEAIWKNPVDILVFSVPIGAAVSLLLYFSIHVDITACVVLAGLIAATPYSIVYEYRQRKFGQFEKSLLDFLRSISSGIKSGLTLPASLKVTSASDLGALTGEVRRMTADLGWGTSAVEALDRFERRVGGSEQVSRATRTMRKASEADADIADVLDILMLDVATKHELERERKGAMGIYSVIMLIMFGIFLFAVYMIVGNVLLLHGQAAGKEVLLFGALDVPLVVKVFMHATILEGIFTGLVAGQSGTGDLRAGIKYSLLMVLIAYAMFAVLVLPKVAA